MRWVYRLPFDLVQELRSNPNPDPNPNPNPIPIPIPIPSPSPSPSRNPNQVISLYVEDAIADGAVSERSAKIMRRNLTMTSVKGDGKGAKKLGGSQADALSQALATLEADDMDPNAEADPLAA